MSSTTSRPKNTNDLIAIVEAGGATYREIAAAMTAKHVAALQRLDRARGLTTATIAMQELVVFGFVSIVSGKAVITSSGIDILDVIRRAAR